MLFKRRDSQPSETTTATTTKRKWNQWFEPNTSSQEKKLILKLDFTILTYSCLSFFIKYLDQTNISNAYVSGMETSLGLGHHNELSWMNTYFSIGTIIGSIPATLLVGYFKPRYYLPAMDLLWSICVVFIYKCKTAQQIYALRFLIGLFESSSNPCAHYIIGSWYTKNEIMRRSGFFVISGVIGQATSSYIQSGLHSNMNGRLGLEAWQWLFIFDGIIGIPVILFGIIFLPDLPQSTSAFYLNDWEKAKAVERVNNRPSKLNLFQPSQIKIVLTSWQFWIFPIGYALWTLTAISYIIQFFELYLKYIGGYTVTQINNIPTAVSAVNLITMIATGVVCDFIHRRWPVCIIVGCILTFGVAVVLKTHNNTFRIVGYIITGVYGCFTPVLTGWCNIACRDNQYLRAITIPTMIVVGQIVVIPVQQNLFPSDDAPYYNNSHGYAFSLAFVVALTVWTGVVTPLVEWYYNGKQEIAVDLESDVIPVDDEVEFKS